MRFFLSRRVILYLPLQKKSRIIPEKLNVLADKAGSLLVLQNFEIKNKICRNAQSHLDAKRHQFFIR